MACAMVRQLQFLRVVELVAAGDAAGMEVADVLDVFADGADDVAFHDLHVVDVVEQLDARRIHRLHHLDAPCGVVALVVLVVHLAVEQFQADGDAVVFGDLLDDALQAERCSCRGLRRRACRARLPENVMTLGTLAAAALGDVVAHVLLELVVVLLAIPADGNVAGAR